VPGFAGFFASRLSVKQSARWHAKCDNAMKPNLSVDLRLKWWR
jgi:hypothetical protein